LGASAFACGGWRAALEAYEARPEVRLLEEHRRVLLRSNWITLERAD
jgi:hypothetical protein